MFIDEKKSIFDLSDYCLIKIYFKLKAGTIVGVKPLAIKEGEFYDVKKEELKQKYTKSLEEDLSKLPEETINMKIVEKIIQEKAEKYLKRKIRRGVRRERTEPIWFNEEIKQSIKKRREYNRKRRNLNDERDREKYQLLYETQGKI